MRKLSLDDLYHMVANIYSDQNAHRTAAATFTHFVEVCGVLTIHDRQKKREGMSIEDALCKALGWYFPLMAKFRVHSLENLIFKKYPNVCPYCRLAPHTDSICKTVRGTQHTVNHHALRGAFKRNYSMKPVGLDEWQKMFQDIYPRGIDDSRSTLGLFEEIGELAEAIRVFEKYPRYFAGEAADVFSYIMGIANEYSLRLQQKEDRQFSFEAEFIKRFPGLCVQCGYQSCICPAIPEATVGRMAKELEIDESESLFWQDSSSQAEKGAQVAAEILDAGGGYAGLLQKFPFDRGGANTALVVLCLRLADLMSDKPEISERLRSAALKAGASATYAGSRKRPLEIRDVVELVHEVLGELGENAKSVMVDKDGLTGKIGKILKAVAVLFVAANPSSMDPIRLATEERAIKEAIQLSLNRESIRLDTLPAATVDDLRRQLMKEEYDIIHFSGHGNETGLIFEDSASGRADAPLTAVASLLSRYPRIRCVILNACFSISDLKAPIAQYTIGMDAAVGDEAAIEFSRGFYDAIGAGKPYESAIAEGKSSVQLKGLELSFPIKVLER